MVNSSAHLHGLKALLSVTFARTLRGCRRDIEADLVVAGAAQVVCYRGNGGWRRRPGHLLGHGGPEDWAPQQVVQAAVGPVVGGRLQTQEV